jgi:hypothetical protein
MSPENDERTELENEELAKQDGEALPDREAMSVLGGPLRPMPIDPAEPIWEGPPEEKPLTEPESTRPEYVPPESQ